MGRNNYHVYVKPSALNRLAAHIEFLARVSGSAAMSLYKHYEASLEFLAEHPESCPIYTPNIPIHAELRFKLFGKRYRIVFEIVTNAVYIYDIQDCRQDSDKNIV